MTSLDVPRTQDRMTHDVWLPDETVELRARARVAVIFEGANELQDWIIARQLIGRDVTG